MKKILFIACIILLISGLQAQDTQNPPAVKNKRFHLGLAYGYTSLSYNLGSYSAHSVWQGVDLGTFTMDDYEIDKVNEHRKDASILNQLLLQFGFVILNKPEGPWYIDGTLSMGISSLKSNTDLDDPRQNNMEVKSGLENPMFGLSFIFRYYFNKHWGLSLMPEMFYMWGNSKNITDSIHPMVSEFRNEMKETYIVGYARITPMATYTFKGLSVSAGPGFHFSGARKEYSIERTNTGNGNYYLDEITTTLVSKSLIDGCMRADWTIIPSLTLSVQGAFGSDLYVNGGLRFNF